MNDVLIVLTYIAQVGAGLAALTGFWVCLWHATRPTGGDQ